MAATEKMMEIQTSMRAKAAHTQDFMRELSSFQADISRRDEQLKAQKAVQKKLPPIRGSSDQPDTSGPQPTPAAGNDQAHPTQARQARLKSGDYRAWDRFDVDAELQRLAEEEAQMETQQAQRAAATLDRATSGSNGSRDGEEQPMSINDLQTHMANVEKDNGNAQFKQGKFAAAITCYTRGLEANPYSATLLSNRSMAHLKLKQYTEAEADATEALALDPHYLKAWSRRATARGELKHYAEAIADWQKVLELDSKNGVAKKEIARLRDPGSPATKKTAPQQWVRVAIEDIGEAPVSSTVSEKPVQASAPPGASTDGRVVEAGASEPPAKTTASANDTQSRKVQIVEVDDDVALAPTETAAQPVQPQAAPLPSSPAPEPTAAPEPTPAATAMPVSTPAPATTPVSVPTPSPVVREASAVTTGLPMLPTTSLEFHRSWHQNTEPSKRAALLQRIDANELPGLLGATFEPDDLISILRVLYTEYLPQRQPIFPVLRKLTKADRFDMMIMFLESEERAWITELIEAVAANTCGDRPSDKLVSALRAKFQCTV
ncbi:uncharacterized protein MONBRDRAFT_36345 [Monosiga brevicollis MX1]|uniref:RNA polymerase II-associated protein 3 n=1 Tax=Monosiga brevicollis TaxID=81824 RepID=A9UV33_MONBE|nr:uncharacterized protein MONBRDRAFT_36345 [Monosiga brevicollis MX1]EDQ90824.1 predicted protein [Monosiga brevicollis MX1]|eukprot:XP_001744121.1 hypothetical protein [Monosiga brevicollis MX1]